MFDQASEAQIEDRCAHDPDFRRMYERHRKLNRRIDGAEHGLEGLSDEFLSQLKLERLHLKDALMRRWEDPVPS